MSVALVGGWQQNVRKTKTGEYSQKRCATMLAAKGPAES